MAEKSINFTGKDRLYYNGKEQYDTQHYNQARRYLQQYLQENKEGESNVLIEEARYYEACCAYEMGHEEEALTLLDQYSRRYPESEHRSRIYLLQGIELCNQNLYKEAADTLARVNLKDLNKENKTQYRFYYGQSLLQMQEYDKAKAQYAELSQCKNRYSEAGKYYVAYIDYLQNNYDEALPIFLELKEKSSYSDIVPYYIVQIYYSKGMTDKVLEYGMELVEKNPNNENNAEIYRLIGESYFDKKDYVKTIQYLSIYEVRVERIYRNDAYMLGVAYFNTQKYDEALQRLKKATIITDDAMAQNSYLYLGSCYLKKEDKNNARMAFEAASKLDFDKNVKEEALYNYCLVVFDQSYSPFNESVTAFESFLTTFPNSKYAENVYDYLINVYMTTKNYQAAYTSIQKISQPNTRVLAARQRVLYCLGIQHFQANEPDSARYYLTKSLDDRQQNYDLEAKSLFWRGEANYRLKKYNDADADWSGFVQSVGAHNTKEFNLAQYNLGYSEFQKKNYKGALTWFRKYVTLEEKNKSLIADANNRIGDCYYEMRDFANAQTAYQKVYNANGPGSDYACFQRAFIQGLQKDYSGKIATLKKLKKNYPKSEYQAEAYYETGRSYVQLEQYQQAINEYDELNRLYYHDPLALKARLQTAMLYADMGENAKAQTNYQKIIEQYPNSEEAKTSIDGLKQIYFEKDDIGGYATYIKSLGGLAEFSASEQDSLTFLSAENIFQKGDWANAAKSLKNYNDNFPNSIFKVKAHFELARCYENLKDTTNAKSEYEFVASQPGTWQAVSSYIHLSVIDFAQKNYEGAIANYDKLLVASQKPDIQQKAQIGKMRCYVKMEQPDSTISNATKVIATQNLDPAVTREALYARAKAYEKKDSLNEALKDYETLSGNCMDVWGAEAEYCVAEYKNHNGDAAGAEKEIFNFIDKNTPHQYWLAKAFILLADIYIAQGKDFDAKQYLQSLQDNYKGQNDNIDTEIKARLDDIATRETKQVKK